MVSEIKSLVSFTKVLKQLLYLRKPKGKIAVRGVIGKIGVWAVIIAWIVRVREITWIVRIAIPIATIIRSRIAVIAWVAVIVRWVGVIAWVAVIVRGGGVIASVIIGIVISTNTVCYCNTNQ